MTPDQSRTPAWALSGRDLCRLMRRHHVTIQTLAQRMAIPMTRVRYRRQHGIAKWPILRDWVEAITGADPGAIPHPIHHRPVTDTPAPDRDGDHVVGSAWAGQRLRHDAP